MQSNIVVGGLLTVAVLLIFLRSGRSTLVIGLAIPTSIIGTFLILSMLGRSLNVISLAGLAFAVGMLVDNAVVVLENIYQHYQRGERVVPAAIKGTREVWGAVLSSTLTTLAVFLPVLFVQEEAGQLFRDIALAISAGGRPVADRLDHGDPDGRRGDPPRPPQPAPPTVAPGVDGAGGDGAVGLDLPRPGPAPPPGAARRRPSAGVLFWPVRRLVLGAARRPGLGLRRGGHPAQHLAAARGPAAAGHRRPAGGRGRSRLSWLLMPKVEYLPSGNRNLVIGIILPPPGYNLDQLVEMGEEIQEAVRPYWDVEPGSPEEADA